MINKFIISAITAVLLFYRPLYSMLLILFLSAEYYYAIFMIYTIKTNKTYRKISIDEVWFGDMALAEIWLCLCKINAFKRVYYFFIKKKKIKVRILILFFIIYASGIPVRLLKLAYYFLTSKENFRDALISLTWKEHRSVRDLKIEVLENEVFLNCNNLFKLSSLILKNNKNLDKSTFCAGMLNLQKTSLNFDKKEEKYGTEEVGLACIFNDKGEMISKTPHYTIIEKDTSIHATSKIPSFLHENQKKDLAMPTLTKPGSRSPGSIITPKISKITPASGRTVRVPKLEIDSIKRNHEEFEIGDDVRNYLTEKEGFYAENLEKNFKLDKKNNTDLLVGLKRNEFSRDLNSANLGLFQKHYDEILEEIQKKNRSE